MKASRGTTVAMTAEMVPDVWGGLLELVGGGIDASSIADRKSLRMDGANSGVV